MFLTHALRAIYRAAVVTGDSLWKYVSLLISGTPPAVTFISDASSSGNVLTLNGDTRPSNFNPYTPGYYSNYFDGTGDYLSGSVSISIGTSDFCMEAWGYWTSFNNGTYGSPLFSLGGTNSQLMIRANKTASASTSANYYSTSNSTFIPAAGFSSGVSAGTIYLNQWTHVALSRQGSTWRLFVNGLLVSTQTDAASLAVAYTSIVIGADTTPANGYMTGWITNARVVVGSAIYTANFTPSTAPLTAVSGTSFLTCQSNRFIDNSVNNIALTKNGDTTVTSFTPFTPTVSYNGSAYFDGTGDSLVVTGTGSCVNFGTSNFTIEGWCYITSLASSFSFFDTCPAGNASPTNRIFIFIGSTGIIYYATSTGGTYLITSSAGAVSANQWTHIALVKSSSQTKLYVNGVQVGSTYADTLNYPAQLNRPILCANGYDGVSYNSTGYISDLRVVNGTAVYTAAFTPPTAPLTAVTNTTLLTCQTRQPAANKQFVDNSGSNLLITQAGNTTQGTFSPYGANWSNYFDGSSRVAFPTGTFTYYGTKTTMEMWIYPTGVTGGYTINGLLANQDASGANGQVGFYTTVTGSTFTLGLYSTVTNGGVTSTITGNMNQWNHVVVQIDCVTPSTTNEVIFYINGVRDAKTYNFSTLTSTGYTATPLCLAGDAYYHNYFTGYISNARVVQGPSYVYTGATIVPSTTPLSSVYTTILLTAQSSKFVDNGPLNKAPTLTGTPTVQRFSPFSPVIQTPTTYSTYFDGTGDYLTATGSAAFTLGTGDFTIECWFYTAVGTNNAMFQLSNTAGGFNTTYTNTIAIGLLAGKINLYGVAGTGITSTGSSYATSTWTHVALVRSSGVTKLYINGVLDTTVGTAGSITDTTSYTMQYVVVGGYYSTAYLWNGYVSNLRVVKGTAVYTAAFTPPTTPLTAITNTSLLTCQSATHIDNSSNAFTLTQNGDAVPRQFNPFGFTNTTTGTAYTPALYGGSAYFDGTGDYITAPTNAAAFSFATGDFTAEMQLYPTAFANYKSLWGCSSGAASSTGFHTGLNASGNVFIYSATAFKVTTTNAMNLNAWNHVAFVRSGTALNIYINGVLGGTWTLTTQTFTDSAGWFGAAPGLASEYYTGYLNDFKITKGTALYKGSFVPPLAPMTAVAGTTLLLNMDKGAAVDSSRNVDMETIGDAKVRDETPYAGSYYSNYFDGTGDYLSVPASTAMVLSGDFTIECWVYTSTLSGNQGIIASSAQRFGLIRLTNYFYWLGSTDLSGSSITISANTWYHVAVSRSGTTLRLFVNGVQANSGTYSEASTSNIWYIGSNQSNEQWNGYISNVRVVKGTALYTSNFTPSTAPLTAVSGTSLLTCQSKSFVDNSSNAFAITRNGDVAVKSVNPFQKNTYSSMYFDGTGDYLNIPTIPTAFVFGSSDFTIEFWSYFAATPAGTVWAGNFNNNTTAYGVWTCYYYAVGEIAFFYNNSLLYKITYTLVPGQWYHIAFVRSGTTIKIFVNGAQVGTTGTISASITTANLQGGGWNIGRSNDAAAYLNGYMADLRITNSARTTGTTFPVPTAPLPTS